MVVAWNKNMCMGFGLNSFLIWYEETLNPESEKKNFQPFLNKRDLKFGDGRKSALKGYPEFFLP